jgi:hypothetical protein
MDDRDEKDDHPGTLGGHFAKMWRERRVWRPASLYLLLAIPVTLILAAPGLYALDNPRKFALHLTLLLVFLFVIILRAAADCLDILRRHRRGQREVFHASFGVRKDSAPGAVRKPHDDA